MFTFCGQLVDEDLKATSKASETGPAPKAAASKISLIKPNTLLIAVQKPKLIKAFCIEFFMI